MALVIARRVGLALAALVSCILIIIAIETDVGNIDFGASHQAPSIQHVLGTDLMGRDVLRIVAHAFAGSLALAAQVTLVAAAIAAAVGACGRTVRARVDSRRVLALIDCGVVAAVVGVVVGLVSLLDSTFRHPVLWWVSDSAALGCTVTTAFAALLIARVGRPTWTLIASMGAITSALALDSEPWFSLVVSGDYDRGTLGTMMLNEPGREIWIRLPIAALSLALAVPAILVVVRWWVRTPRRFGLILGATTWVLYLAIEPVAYLVNFEFPIWTRWVYLTLAVVVSVAVLADLIRARPGRDPRLAAGVVWMACQFIPWIALYTYARLA